MELEQIAVKMRGRHFDARVFENAEQAKNAALEIIGGRSVGIGGSATVRDMGLADALRARGNEVHWHWGIEKERMAAERDAAAASDVYVCSSNAILEDGRIVNIDGTGNRVAALIYGPSTVIVIAGRNKLAKDLDDGIERTRRDCCPKNAQRQNLDTPCARTGKCGDCRTAARMCNVIAVLEAPTRRVEKFYVLLVNEDLGL